MKSISSKKFYIGGAAISLLLAGVVSFYASSHPDGLEKVASEIGFIDSAKEPATSGSALADYGVAGIENERASVGIAGVLGVAATGVVATGLFLYLGKRKKSQSLMRESGEAAHGHHHGHDVGERLYIHRHSPIHDLPPHLKIISLLTFLVICVATPIQNYWAFIGFAATIIALLALAKLPVFTIAKRATIEIPFLIFAFLMPFFSKGERFELLFFEISRPGAIAALSIITKGTLGVLTAILLSGSTPAREILRGFELLKMPSLLVQIMTFMLRYMNVITDEMERMKVARLSRGFEERGIRDWKFIAGTAGALFVRSYERGERVHTSMIARGYTGELPKTETPEISSSSKFLAVGIPLAALLITSVTGALS